VPLSEHEQRVLEQMEHAMEVEDPKFATAMRGSSPRARQRRRILYGCIGGLAGLGLVVVGVARSAVPLAVGGFLLMIGAGAVAVAPVRRPTTGPIGTVAPDGSTRKRRRPKQAKAPGTFMQRLERRWDSRRDGQI
jgi:hypothetical protein